MAMKWTAAPQAIIDAWDAASPMDPLAQRKKMFGYPAGFVNGNMFGGVWQDVIVLRLPEPKRREAVEAGAAPFEPMGRSKKEYVVLPRSLIEDHDALSRWVDDAFQYAASLPVKEPKPRRAKSSNR